MAATERRTAARGAEARAAAHAPAAHSTCHGAGMHSAAAAHATTAHAATAMKGKGRGRKSKCGAECARDEATKELVVHLNSSVAELPRRIPSQEEDDQEAQKDPCFQMKNATVSDTEISFNVPLLRTLVSEMMSALPRCTLFILPDCLIYPTGKSAERQYFARQAPFVKIF
jgi:hypothetical protein